MSIGPTGGGLFDPQDPHLYFVAGDAGNFTFTHPHRNILQAANDLTSPGTIKQFEQGIADGKVLMLDSGVYNLTSTYCRDTGRDPADVWAMNPQDIPGFPELWDLYVRLARTYESDIWGYVEMDLGGVESKRRLREKLNDLGLFPIPVYHPLADGWDYFDELAETHDRVCWANLAGTPQPVRKRLVATAYQRAREYPHLWVHLLGFTPNEWLPGMPLHSADSSSWLRGIRWGFEQGTSYLRPYGRLSGAFSPELGGGSQREHAVNMASANAHFAERNWHTIMDQTALAVAG